jgi:tetratricopeptide (TPR) repeat protein
VADAPEGLPEPGRVQDSTSNPRPEELPREVEVAPEPAGIVEPIEPIASEPVVADGPRERAEWPSAKAIFAAQAPRPNPGPVKVKARAKAARDIVPTAGVAPRGWKVPGFRWIGPPLIAAALVSGAGGTWLAWAWARDEQAAGAVVDRLLVDRRPLAPEDAAAMVEAAPTGTSWWRSTAGHLLLRAVVAERSGDAEGGRALLDAARGAAPLEPGVRFALAHLDEGSPAGALGLSRDVAPLAWTGRRLLDAGKLEAGLRAYRAALDLAAGAEPARLPYPAFLDDPRTRRYALPREALIGPVVRDLAGRDDWPFERWSAALPDSAVVALAAGRALLERDSPDAPKVLEQALAAPEPAEGRARAEHLAATAEALALLGRWDEAERGYREAIAAGVDDRDRRAWQFNLAEVRGRLGDDAGRDEARAAAKGNDPNDEIARRAARAQHEAGGGRDREPLRR